MSGQSCKNIRTLRSSATRSLADLRRSDFGRNRLLNYFFQLAAEHVHGATGTYADRVATECDMQPVAFLAFDNKLGQVGFSRRALTGLRDDIDEEVPSPRLSHLSQHAPDCFFLFLCPTGIRTDSD